MDKNFWKTKPLSKFSEEEWEAVCMKCGICCLCKNAKNDKVYFTNTICDGYDFKTGKCSRYSTRLCADCAKVDMRLLENELELLPETCAYRLLFLGLNLPKYHPLVTGNPNSAHEAKKTVMEMENIHSITELDKILEEYSDVLAGNATAKQRENAFKKLDTLKLRYVAIYDIPKKN